MPSQNMKCVYVSFMFTLVSCLNNAAANALLSLSVFLSSKSNGEIFYAWEFNWHVSIYLSMYTINNWFVCVCAFVCAHSSFWILTVRVHVYVQCNQCTWEIAVSKAKTNSWIMCSIAFIGRSSMDGIYLNSNY